MKKLSIEEKAKHYDEALERAKEINNEQKAQPFNIMLKVFPELKESEDERIRKAIIRHFQTGTEYISFSGLSKSKILSWLERQGNINPTEDELEALRIAAYEPTKNWSEKLQSLYEKLTHCEQGEQKPVAKYKVGDTIYYNSFGRLVSFVIANIVEDGTDNPMYEDKDGNSVFQNDIVEPKFKIGDLITNGILVGEIDEIHELGYHAYFGDHYADVPDIENWHKWTIADAKDGDVLFTSSTASYETFAFKGIDEKGNAKCYFTYDSEDGFREGTYHFIGRATNCKPATKEQRDLLFSKMKDNGYEWNAKKKELKKIEQKLVCSEEQHEKESLSDIENRIINFAMQFHDNRMKPEAEWEDELKMLRDNIKIDPWSEEDEKMLNDIIMCGEHHCYLDAGNIAWLKFFKDRVLSKQEWSEKDELMFEASISFIKSSPYPYFGDTLRGEISKIEAENWIKFLKDRVQLQPNPAWSEEDKKMFVNIKACLRNANKDYSREVDWLIKSIKFQPKNKWSEEDESILSHIINNLKFLKDTISIDPNYFVNITDIEREINLLKSIKDRVQSQLKQEWSEEDDNCLSTIIAEFSKCAGKSVSKDEWMRCNDFLNSLRDRVQPQPKQEWSEKDEAVLDALIRRGEYVYVSPHLAVEWLKSLKNRYTWKPSDEQIGALANACNGKILNLDHLNSLYQDLKKLKG